MPPWILAAIPAVLVAIAVLAIIIRPIARAWAEKLADRDLERMIGALKGAISVIGPIADSTPTNVDNDVLDKVLKVALDEFVAEYKRRPKVSTPKLANVAKSLVIKSASASGAPVGVPVGRIEFKR